MFLLIWYSVSTTLFQMIRSKIFISDCVVFFDTIATFDRAPAFQPVSLLFSDGRVHNPVPVLPVSAYLDIPLSWQADIKQKQPCMKH